MRERTGTPGLVAATVISALVLSGVVLRAASVRPGELLGFTAYNHVFSTHAVLAVGALPLLLIHFAPRAEPGRDRRTLSVVFCVVGALFIGLSLTRKVPVVVGSLFALVGTAVFLWTVVRPQRRTPTVVVVALAAASVAMGLIGLALDRPFWTIVVTRSVVATVLSLAVFVRNAAQGDKPWHARAIAVILSVAWYDFGGLFGQLGIVAGVVAGFVLGAIVFASAHGAPSAWTRWVGRIEAALFLEGVALDAFVRALPDDLGFVQDTLLPIAAAHFLALVLVFAFVRDLDGASRSRFGWVGLAVASVGAQLFCWGCAVLGLRGQPRAYASYLDSFASLQAATSVGALILLAGLLAIVGARVSTSPPTPASDAPGPSRSARSPADS